MPDPSPAVFRPTVTLAVIQKSNQRMINLQPPPARSWASKLSCVELNDLLKSAFCRTHNLGIPLSEH